MRIQTSHRRRTIYRFIQVRFTQTMAKSRSMPVLGAIFFLVAVHLCTTEGAVLGGKWEPSAQHTDFFDRLNHSTRDITKCGVVTCPPGTQIRPCMENNTMDTCENCPEGTEMLDSTTSSQEVFPCQKKKKCSDYEHAINSTVENYCFDNTVRMQCKCDTQNGWCGEPCNCNRPPVSCKPGQLLLQDCSCVEDSVQVPSTEHTKTSSTPSTSTTDLTTEQTRSPTLDPPTPLPSAPQSSNIMTIEGTSHSSPTSERDFVQENNSSPEEYEDEVSWKTVGVVFGLLLLVVLTVAAFFKRDELKKLLGKIPPFKNCDYFRVSTSDN